MKKITCLLISIFSTLLISCGGGESDCQTKHCKDFRTQKAAQKAYDSDRDCYQNLDADRDGVACESLED